MIAAELLQSLGIDGSVEEAVDGDGLGEAFKLLLLIPLDVMVMPNLFFILDGLWFRELRIVLLADGLPRLPEPECFTGEADDSDDVVDDTGDSRHVEFVSIASPSSSF